MDKIRLGTRNVSIEFPGVKALTDVNFEVSTGEIHALVGANGAGKSTLMKVLAGANPDYTGEVYLNDQVVDLRTTLAAKKLGIQIVYQEVDMALIPTLSVAENVMLNDTVMNGRYIMNWKSLYKRAAEVLQRLNIQVDTHKLVQDLSLAQKQMVLIARAIVNKCNFLILDEPTAPLSDTETEELFRLVKHLQATENIAIIFISHRINEIIRICERYTVMRNGMVVDTTDITPQTTTKEIVDKMLGRAFEENFPKEEAEIGEDLFTVEHLSGADVLADLTDMLPGRGGRVDGDAAVVIFDELLDHDDGVAACGDRVARIDFRELSFAERDGGGVRRAEAVPGVQGDAVHGSAGVMRGVDSCVDRPCRDAPEGVLHADALGAPGKALLRQCPQVILLRLLKRHVCQIRKSRGKSPSFNQCRGGYQPPADTAQISRAADSRPYEVVV